MKILVTGANGYLGMGIVKELLDHCVEVVATDFSSDNIDSRADIHECDLFSAEDPFEFFGEPDAVLHLAWRDGFNHYSDVHILDLSKHYFFLRRMIESGVKKAAIVGSMHEIGGEYEGCVNENTPCNPTTPYGISKNALRLLMKQLTESNDVRFLWLRGYYIVGNTRYGNSIFSKLVAASEDGQQEFPFTMGQNQYDFLDYQIFCKQVCAVVCQDEISGIVEICSGKPEKLADRVERFIEENHLDISLAYGAFPERSYDSKAIWGDRRKMDAVVKKVMMVEEIK